MSCDIQSARRVMALLFISESEGVGRPTILEANTGDTEKFVIAIDGPVRHVVSFKP